MIWGEADIINKVHNTCNALESSPNRALLRAPIPTLPHSPSTKNCLPWNQSLVPERLRMAGVGWIVEDYWNNGLPQRLRGKEPACKAGNTGEVDSIPGLGRSSRGGCGNPLQYSCLENPMDRRAWQATVHRVAKSWAWWKWLSRSTDNRLENMKFLFAKLKINLTWTEIGLCPWLQGHNV